MWRVSEGVRAEGPTAGKDIPAGLAQSKSSLEMHLAVNRSLGKVGELDLPNAAFAKPWIGRLGSSIPTGDPELETDHGINWRERFSG